MKWTKPVRDRVAAHLEGLDLEQCPLCHEEIMYVYEKPAMLLLGGTAWPSPGDAGPLGDGSPRGDGSPTDTDAQLDLLVRVECRLCGYNLLLNGERFATGDTPTLQAQQAPTLQAQQAPLTGH